LLINNEKKKNFTEKIDDFYVYITQADEKIKVIV